MTNNLNYDSIPFDPNFNTAARYYNYGYSFYISYNLDYMKYTSLKKTVNLNYFNSTKITSNNQQIVIDTFNLNKIYNKNTYSFVLPMTLLSSNGIYENYISKTLDVLKYLNHRVWSTGSVHNSIKGTARQGNHDYPVLINFNYNIKSFYNMNITLILDNIKFTNICGYINDFINQSLTHVNPITFYEKTINKNQKYKKIDTYNINPINLINYNITPDIYPKHISEAPNIIYGRINSYLYNYEFNSTGRLN